MLLLMNPLIDLNYSLSRAFISLDTGAGQVYMWRGSKPEFEIGASKPLSFSKKPAQTKVS